MRDSLPLALALLAAAVAVHGALCTTESEFRRRIHRGLAFFEPLDEPDWHEALLTRVVPAVKKLARGAYEDNSNQAAARAAARATLVDTSSPLPPALPCKLRLLAVLVAFLNVLRMEDACGREGNLSREQLTSLRGTVLRTMVDATVLLEHFGGRFAQVGAAVCPPAAQPALPSHAADGS